MSWEEKIMKSKTSYFNKAVFKKDMTQFWSLWAVEIVISLLIFIMPLMSSVNGKNTGIYGQYIKCKK